MSPMPVKNNVLANKRTPSPSLSARNHQLTSPLPSRKDCGQISPAIKRKQTALDVSISCEQDHTVKRRFLSKDKCTSSDKEEYDPVTYWALNKDWPQDFALKGRVAAPSTGTKKRSDSSHSSVYIQRLAEQGVYGRASTRIQDASKILCRQLFDDRRARLNYTCFPVEQFLNVLDRVRNSNESRIRRDIMPWIVPSTETLHFCGELGLDYIGDEVNAKWIRCTTMGGTIPQPDYVAGLLPKAFTKEEREKLMDYCTPERPFYFTSELCYPFLVCEVKTGERGMGEANRQNTHSASIAVRAIIELHKAAFEKSRPEKVSDIYGKVLVFSISHNHNLATLRGHFATLADNEPDTLEYFHHDIAFVGLSINDGVDSLMIYGFVRNIYDKFAKEHLQRIRDATAALPMPTRRINSSFAVSDLALEQPDSQRDSQGGSGPQDRTDLEVPNLPASAMKLFEQQKVQLENQMEDQRLDSQRKEQWMETQMEQQRQENKQREQQMEKQMEQRRQQMEQQMEQRKQQMEQQMQQMEQQTQQMEEIISLLRKTQS